MLPEKQHQIFQSFVASVKQNGILEPKTSRLIFLAVSMALGCYP